MNWTKKTPTQPGFYFVRWNTVLDDMVSVAEITYESWDKSLHVSILGTTVEDERLNKDGTTAGRKSEWAGPIPLPDEAT